MKSKTPPNEYMKWIHKSANNYTIGRRTDPYIESQIHAKLRGASSLLNIGAGTGSYEPSGMMVAAVEPSEAKVSQRYNSAIPVWQAHAECLPFEDECFSHSMTILSMHHWKNRKKAFAEIKRVTRDRFVAVTWDPDSAPFWLSRDYFPEIHDIDKSIYPKLSEFEDSFKNVGVSVLNIPANCADGFLAAYWKRPEAYLDELVRANISTFSKISDYSKGFAQLQNDIHSGKWESRNKELSEIEFFDAGYRLITVDLSSGNAE
ncbi:MAG: SAM-dependent methyltransferase [Enterobacterales bacterium]|jgi:SAM-dependent methyltransferase